ncbi:MAG: hypothetical protein E6J34_23345 [Chloroflexi bacterium]|nr:MAG: hypothetical protein E6J34_23345 [Chloroflexota bacterium]
MERKPSLESSLRKSLQKKREEMNQADFQLTTSSSLIQESEVRLKGLTFIQIHEENIQTEYSAMNSIADQTGQINLVLVEPKEGKRQSQIEEFLKFYGAPGTTQEELYDG